MRQLFYYKVRQALLQSATSVITKCDKCYQSATSVITKCDKCYQSATSVITKCDRYYKVRQVLLRSATSVIKVWRYSWSRLQHNMAGYFPLWKQWHECSPSLKTRWASTNYNVNRLTITSFHFPVRNHDDCFLEAVEFFQWSLELKEQGESSLSCCVRYQDGRPWRQLKWNNWTNCRRQKEHVNVWNWLDPGSSCLNCLIASLLGCC